MSCDYSSNRSIPLGSAWIKTLDNAGPKSFMKIYCACGSMVDLDRREMNVKRSLKKELECTACRNARISREIDFLNECPDGSTEEE